MCDDFFDWLKQNKSEAYLLEILDQNRMYSLSKIIAISYVFRSKKRLKIADNFNFMQSKSEICDCQDFSGISPVPSDFGS